MTTETADVAIVGGGLHGLTLAWELARQGWRTFVFERRHYPFHRVCGEYLSAEVAPLLRKMGVDHALAPVSVNRLEVSAPSGNMVCGALPLGGLGVSRYRLDATLAQAAGAMGAHIYTGVKVMDLERAGEQWKIHTAKGIFYSRYVVGAFGKRSNMDRRLQRRFLQKKSPFVGIKHHIRADIASDTIALHNFQGGYAGVSRIEDGRSCLCYLVRRSVLQEAGGIEALEQSVLRRNPHLDALWKTVEFEWDKPLVINEISFSKKPLYEGGVWCGGDAAGMIAPLAGNGMAMAMNGALMHARSLHGLIGGTQTAVAARRAYQQQWRSHFGKRLWLGRRIQHYFGDVQATERLVRLFQHMPRQLGRLVAQTHGKPEHTQRLLEALP